MDADKRPSFTQHMFQFDDATKSDTMNIVQYVLLSLIPVVILNKMMQRYVPEADESKSSIEMVVEIVLQLIVMFLGIFFIHRLVTYFPPYSGSPYIEFNVTTIVLATLVVILSLQSKLGEKVSILVDRVVGLWDGSSSSSSSSSSKKDKGNNKQGMQTMSPGVGGTTLTSTSLASLPTMTSGMASGTQKQPTPDFNAMYQQHATPLVDAQEPMPANMGGGGFGSAFW